MRSFVAKDSAVALVITLLMLSVITFLAIAFLAMTRRDRSAVTATLDVDTARSMSDAALARAQTEIIAQMMAQTDILSYDYTASHNFITPAESFTSGIANSNDVNYDYFINSGGLTPANAQAWAQNIANLFYDPRPPVFVMTNGNLTAPSYDFRYWVDINRNGKFESNGVVSNLNVNGVLDGTVSNYNGEPEWIGVLKYPEYVHSPTNPFIGRYAFMALPIGKTLDLNFIHNDSKALLLNSPVTLDGFIRDEGVGSWELNLAALLNDINTNMYPPSGSDVYFYNPVSTNTGNTGYCFDDAVQFIRFRYASTYDDNYYPFSLNYMLGTPPLSEVFNIDEYGLYPAINPPFDYAGSPVIEPNFPWPGTYNSNMFYDVQDLFDPNKTGTNNANPGGIFANRFAAIMTNLDSYDRYTMQRLLACIGTSSAPEYGVYVYSNLYTNSPLFAPAIMSAVATPGFFPPPSLLRTKVNINYDNTAQIQAGPYSSYGSYTPMPTNLMRWTPLGFFTNAADLLLRSQVYTFTNYVTNYPGFPGVFYPSNYLLATFGITNIPVYVSTNPGIVYNEQIHRMLQVAANIYDAAYSTNLAAAGATPVYHPSVFRPLLQYTNYGGNSFAVNIVGYAQVLPSTRVYNQILSQGFKDITNSTITTNDFVWGIPWVVAADKWLPAFDQYIYTSRIEFLRQLLFVRQTNSAGPITNAPPASTNQFYVMQISNLFGMDAWNPYMSNFHGASDTLTVIATNFVTITLTNNAAYPYNFWTNFTFGNYTKVSFTNTWPASSQSPETGQTKGFKTFLQTNFVFLPLVYYSEALQQLVVLTNNGTPFDGFLAQDIGQKHWPTHYWSLNITNHVCYALFDGNATSGTLLDFVNLGPFGSSANITQLAISNSIGQSPGEFAVAPSTDIYSSSPMSQGVLNQITDAVNNDSTGAFYGSLNGLTPCIAGAWFTTIAAGLGTILTPFYITDDMHSWEACDPLVHYTTGDLTYPQYSAFDKGEPGTYMSSPSMTHIGQVTTRYTPWPGPSGSTPANNMLFIDPLITSANAWQFPTNLFPGVGWLGRVHRGTPWQTIYLKSDNPNGEAYPTNDWTTWWVNSPYTYPTNDWALIDLFTAVPNDNAARGLLSVNQTNDAAWAAVFGGVIAITNSTLAGIPVIGVPINPANDVTNMMDYTNGTAVGINQARMNAIHPNGLFHHIGDILQASTLSVNSPFWTNIPSADLTDEMVERIPQQTLSLLKLGLPQFVIYSWGQSLKPKDLYSSGSAPLLNICTNYEITGEYLTRSVCHIVSDPGAAAPKIVIDNYNIMPGN
jgi:hypothetical protein